MKVYTNNHGTVIAEAESLADVTTLLGIGARRSKKATKKYKTPCPLCGKRVENHASHMAHVHKTVNAA